VFQCRYDDLADQLCGLRSILSPDAILRNHPAQEVDNGIPIGPGLRSIALVTSGLLIYETNTLKLRPLIGLTMSISEGSIERDENGLLRVYIDTIVPFRSMQRLNERLGLHSLEMCSRDCALSADPACPTVFVATTEHILPAGEIILDLATWQELAIPQNVRVCTQATAVAYLENRVLLGRFNAHLSYPNQNCEIGLGGSFQTHLL
jgi:hypothetical protein